MALDLDIDKMKEIVQKTYEVRIIREYGEDGVIVLRTVLDSVREIYKFINPETIQGSLIVFQDVFSIEPSKNFGEPVSFTELSYLAMYCDAPRSKGTIIIQVGNPNQFYVWKTEAASTLDLSKHAVVYSFSDNKESIIVEEKSFDIINPTKNQYASVFSIPTYRSLSEALDHYKWQSIKTSRCQVFSQAWHPGPNSNRLFFRKGPEEQMRKSLTSYLQNVLRDANVHPEINVDESHPVDIQVTWLFTNRVAIIEIKWLGNSLSDSGGFVEYREARANEGAKQLAEYLDAKHTWAPIHEVMGYLVVFDARRRNLTPSSQTIDTKNGLWYRDKDIVYNPQFHKNRFDFAEPIRMFTEPKCSPS